MSKLTVDTIEPSTGTTITIGGSGDTVSLGSGASASGFTSGIVGVSTFTSSGTWTKATREAALGVTIKRVIVEVQGAGGSGSAHSTNYATGGAGAYVKKLLDVSAVTSSTITVGSGGASISGGGGAGNAGGASSWADGVNTTLTGGGGNAGKIDGTKAAAAIASGGDFNRNGQGGSWNVGESGSSFLGYSTRAGASNYPDGGNGYLGGGGGYGYTSYASGAGGDGIVIVTEIAG